MRSDSPWPEPEAAKIKITLTTGQSVDNKWLFANGARIPPADVERILNTPSLKALRVAMLKCFARSLRDTYRMRWCAIYGKRANSWRDTGRSNKGFLQAAEYLAEQYATRNMTADTFVEACYEMRPRTLKFPTADMLGGATGARVADWLPPEQRTADKSWSAHEDKDGTTWVTPQGESPVMVIRTKADRDRLLRQNKVG